MSLAQEVRELVKTAYKFETMYKNTVEEIKRIAGFGSVGMTVTLHREKYELDEVLKLKAKLEQDEFAVTFVDREEEINRKLVLNWQ